MFSGIKSMIFGYTETNDESPDSNETTSSPSSLPKDIEQAPTSALLEQTLNAATTKFTEQLLPQQASIEQLQSSSHQLLPTLNEQLGIDQARESLTLPVDQNDGDDEDDDCFNADSWEMLDLNEKATIDVVDEAHEVIAEKEVNSTVQRGGEKQTSKSSSGILKTNDSLNSVSVENKQRQQKQQQLQKQKQRPKPRVSFETPDLVKDKHKIETINNTKPKQEEPKSQPKQGNKNKKRNKLAEGAKLKSANVVDAAGAGAVAAVEEVKQGEVSTSWPSMPQQSVTGITVAKQQGLALNYSAALSLKPKTVACKNFVCPVYGGDEQSIKSSGAVKRNRPVSTSSWSSNDQLENDEDSNVWDDIKKSIDEGEAAGSSMKDIDDNESIMSSGFSDCDYGYEGLNDFFMRPKRSGAVKSGRNGGLKTHHIHVKRARRGAQNPSTSSAPSDAQSSKSAKAVPGPQAATTVSKTTPSKATKADKKKSISSGSGKSSDFLKVNKNNDKHLTKLNPSSTGAGASSSNDSSDIADMDESWYVTPPPCFTGANKQSKNAKVKPSKPKGDELDARENALIEHPSIYIASTSSKAPTVAYTPVELASYRVKGSKNRVQGAENKVHELKPIATASPIVPKKEIKSVEIDDAWKSDEDEDIDFDYQSESLRKSKQIKKPIKQTPEFKLVTNKKNTQLESLRESNSKPMKPGEKKAWKNKFTVDDWNLDDQDDPTSDFDDMFECARRNKGKQAKKRQQRQQKQPKLAPPVESGPALVDFDSDVSLGSNEDDSSNSVEIVFNEDSKSTMGTIIEQQVAQSQDADMGQENQQPVGVQLRSMPLSPGKPAAIRPPVPVKPIEPERKPGWQLKRQRSKRRPLAASNCSPNKLHHKSSKKATAAGGNRQLSSSSSPSSDECSSARSTPSLIDRIGSSIVANLNNLTGGFASSPVVVGATAKRARSNLLIDGQEQHQPQHQHAGGVGSNSLAAFASSEQHDLQIRKRLSKGFLRRQNVSARQANSQRRPGRGLRMFTTQNGVSVNRKVHTNFH